ncbi:glycosyltransferase family 8 protein [Gemmata sp. JC673]|uniref:Glycosyltransferase family 8 protein n=1 Tax=Gemmata algarum TaxID=2975278 RepID=A0ABU5EV34_9BACT|nr:glycosyltransferase family 8 protein [Gemmata algarum]MDY3558315.1 glycosyltransferase family 8 protein [Gemmata algarum]
MSDDRIVIVSGADEAYALPLAVTLFSVAERLRPTEAADIYVLDGGFTERSRDRFRRVLAATGRDVTIKFLQPQLKLLEGVPPGRMGAMAYLRVLIPDSLPPEITHAIYLDSDLLVQDSLADLWHERSEAHAIAAVPDYGGPQVSSPACLPNWSELGLPPDAPYINTGVLVMNLKWWRSENVGRRILDHSIRFRELNRYADQDGVNAVLCRECKTIDLRWNVPAYLEFDSVFAITDASWVKDLVAPQREERLDRGAIVHFIGNRKPWKRGLASRMQRRWLAAMARSGWFAGDPFGRLRLSLPIWADYRLRGAVRLARRLRR